MNTLDNKLKAFERTLTIMDELREKCPWDKKQTFESLRHLTIEETYELSEAITKNDLPELKKELGDVFLHLIFYAKIASEKHEFDIADVLNTLCDKLIIRHPHIYGDVIAETEEQVKENWEQIKLKEGNKSVLSGVSSGIPSLVKAYRMQEKAAQVGFDWETSDQVWDKVTEELNELKVEMQIENNKQKSTEEFGDLLFAMVNFARKNGINPDDALELTNKKFKNRFMFIEEKVNAANKKMTDLNLTELDEIWNESKKLGIK
jgi:XTP/dITP diphosphohydrolase